jgi:hypothetical protein
MHGMDDNHLPLRIWALASVILVGEAVIWLLLIAGVTIAVFFSAKIAADLFARWF